MAWLSRINFVSSDTLSFTDINNLGNDIRAWGGNVNGGGYTLSNVAISASSSTMATVIGGTGTTSTLTLRSTSGVGTTGADIIFQTGTNGASEVMRVQNGGNVGIGTPSPVARLHARGSGTALPASSGSTQSAGVIQRYNDSSTAHLDIGGAAASGMWLQVSDDTNLAVPYPLLLQPVNGNVGIGTTAPAYQLQISTDSAAKPSTNTWTIASDARLKTVRGEYEKGLAEICALRPVRYEYNGKGGFAADGAEHVSILAQEAQEVFPECINSFRGKLEEDGEEVDLLNYNGHAITFALINAIKELKAMIERNK